MTEGDVPGDEQAPTGETEDHGGPRGYPPDPGRAYDPEPEPPDKAFSEPQHWLEPGRRQRRATGEPAGEQAGEDRPGIQE